MYRMNRILPLISLSIVAVIFAWTLLNVGFTSSPYAIPKSLDSRYIAWAIIAALVLMIWFLPARTRPISKFLVVFWILSTLIAYPFAITNSIFGLNDMEAILIFFRDNQAEDIAKIGGISFLTPIIVSLVILGVLWLSSFYLISRKHRFDRIVFSFGLLFLAISPITQFVKNMLITNEIQVNFDFDTEIKLDITARPDVQKNLIVIYVESLERTYGDIDISSEAYRPIQKMADNAIEAVNIQQTVGTNFSIAGIVASQCGVPLVPQGLSYVIFQKRAEGSLQDFLPSMTCLGDVLNDDGYEVSYLNGASLDRFSKRSFLLGHGYDRVTGLDEIPEERKLGRTNAFGMNDALTFELAREEYDQLVTLDDPFALTILTVSTHGPLGFLDNNCPPVEGASSQIPTAISCTAELLADFIDYTKSKNNGRETEIIVLNDHLAMRNTMEQELKATADTRRNLFFVQNASAPSVIDRAATPFDIFPTILDSLGYELADDQANLGRSMFQSSKNLIERYGPDDLYQLLKGNYALSKFLWRPIVE